MRAIRRTQVQLGELLIERLVFAQRHRQRRPQRHAFGAEEREFLLDAFDDAREPIAPLVAARRACGRTAERAAGKLVVPDEGADRRRVAGRLDLDSGRSGRSVW